ncbi:MAG TPA: antibiotic biosynthesis monooxygenase [Dehalococcoidia bacterium]|nr:antibiotic biosynthesis monooxygenase [Dehalococcoidia bacterium]
MATFLGHAKIKPDKLEQWEETIQASFRETHGNEEGVLRYEFWKGQEPYTYYALLSFKGKEAFFVHQDAPYHRTLPFGECFESFTLESIDPVDQASPLPRTSNPPLRADAPNNLKEWEPGSSPTIADWWSGRS